MISESIELKLQEDINKLYAELAISTDETVRTPLLPSKEIINEGKKRFDEIRKSLENIICSEKTMKLVNSHSEKKEAVIVLTEIITATLGSIHFPVITVACLIVRIGINRICRNSTS